MADRVGSFVFSAEELSGDCGELPDEVAEVTDPTATTCPKLSPDVVSDDECSFKRHLSCPGKDGSALEIISETIQRDPSADLLSGEESYTLRDPDGLPLCSGRYAVTFERR